MGRAKAAMMEHEDNISAAGGYLADAGMLEHCEFHGITYGGGYSGLDSDFYRRAMADRNRGDNGPIPWAAELEAREFTDLLKEAFEEEFIADECYACAKNAAS